MTNDNKVISDAVQFLRDGGENEAANVLSTCALEEMEVIDDWWDGCERIDGLLIVLRGPRITYEILSNRDHPFTKSIENAFSAVLPSHAYFKTLKIRASASSEIAYVAPESTSATQAQVRDLIQQIETQKGLMLEVATGGRRIQMAGTSTKVGR